MLEVVRVAGGVAERLVGRMAAAADGRPCIAPRVVSLEMSRAPRNSIGASRRARLDALHALHKGIRVGSVEEPADAGNTVMRAVTRRVRTSKEFHRCSGNALSGNCNGSCARIEGPVQSSSSYPVAFGEHSRGQVLLDGAGHVCASSSFGLDAVRDGAEAMITWRIRPTTRRRCRRGCSGRCGRRSGVGRSDDIRRPCGELLARPRTRRDTNRPMGDCSVIRLATQTRPPGIRIRPASRITRSA